MSCEINQEFSNKDPGETVILSFVYTKALAIGEVLQSIVGAPIVTVVGGVDAAPGAILAGLPAINLAAPTSVQLPVTGGIIGVQYNIKMLCLTSIGQTLACSGTLTIANI
jgi:hypothetical protein